jgi:hypothetical protein
MFSRPAAVDDANAKLFHGISLQFQWFTYPADSALFP